MYKILIVEDDLNIAKLIKEHLESWQFDVIVVENFAKIMEIFDQSNADLVLMDIGLPFYNGYHWCTEIRKTSTVPIVFISSADDNLNIVMAMNMGADDFVAKPFDLSVLVAKIQALLRRTYAFHSSAHLLTYKSMNLNVSEAVLTNHQDRIELSKNELKILQTLMEQPSKIISRNDLMNRLWESDSFIDDNTLTVNINRLRKKIESIGLEGVIKTKKGLGYTLVQEEGDS